MGFMVVSASTSTAHLGTTTMRHIRGICPQVRSTRYSTVLTPPHVRGITLRRTPGPASAPCLRHFTTPRVVWQAATSLKPLQPSHSIEKDPSEASRRKAAERLRPVIDSFNGPIDWAAAYGSGVIAQANASSDQPAPLIDFLIAVPSSAEFHAANLRQYPAHYPLYGRLLGASAIAWLQDHWGAGMWYVTNVRIQSLEVKYGLISTERLLSDLKNWDTLYLAGRLHKPVLLLSSLPAYDQALQTNLHHALAVSLLFLPSRFSEMELWEQIAGISYSGDPRMSIPGAENPQKVKNIVRGEGVQIGMREMYRKSLGLMQTLGLDMESEGEEWRFEQPDMEIYRAALFAQIPLKLQRAIAVRAGVPVSETTPIKPDDIRPVLIRPDFRSILQQELSNIMRRPALTQSLKGLFTAGLTKSIYYSFAKIGKWWRGRQTK